MSKPDIALEVKELKTEFRTDNGVARAVDGVSFVLHQGKTLALVGESGCGKSVTSLSIMRLIPSPPGRIVSGDILFEGKNLRTTPESTMRTIRGNGISMIFQEPMTSLNPVFRVGSQIASAIRVHRDVSKLEARNLAIEMLRKVGISSPEKRVDDYPFQMSGGMRQRVMIAMALACNPKVLIADEPTTALDVTIQAQILDLLRQLQSEFNMAVLLITHNLGIVAEMAEEVAIMYAGKIVEQAPVKAMFDSPQHPYTQGLFRSLPSLTERRDTLFNIRGIVPPATRYPAGCRFHPRCLYTMERCKSDPPGILVGEDHTAVCWLHDPVAMKEEGRPVGLHDAQAGRP
ncbi:MAG: ABC transporter ATP-binding protein [Candidatus Hydrogenedentota bacterium]